MQLAARAPCIETGLKRRTPHRLDEPKHRRREVLGGRGGGGGGRAGLSISASRLALERRTGFFCGPRLPSLARSSNLDLASAFARAIEDLDSVRSSRRAHLDSFRVFAPSSHQAVRYLASVDSCSHTSARLARCCPLESRAFLASRLRERSLAQPSRTLSLVRTHDRRATETSCTCAQSRPAPPSTPANPPQRNFLSSHTSSLFLLSFHRVKAQPAPTPPTIHSHLDQSPLVASASARSSACRARLTSSPVLAWRTPLLALDWVDDWSSLCATDWTSSRTWSDSCWMWRRASLTSSPPGGDDEVSRDWRVERMVERRASSEAR